MCSWKPQQIFHRSKHGHKNLLPPLRGAVVSWAVLPHMQYIRFDDINAIMLVGCNEVGQLCVQLTAAPAAQTPKPVTFYAAVLPDYPAQSGIMHLQVALAAGTQVLFFALNSHAAVFFGVAAILLNDNHTISTYNFRSHKYLFHKFRQYSTVEK